MREKSRCFSRGKCGLEACDAPLVVDATECEHVAALWARTRRAAESSTA